MNINQLSLGLSYHNVVLLPKLGILPSRAQADVSCKFLGKRYKLPVCPANMKCVINFELAEWFSKNEYFYILHRFYDYEEVFKWIANNQSLPLISISLGVNEKDRDFITKLVDSGFRVDVITLDISHGFSQKMEYMIKYIKGSGYPCKIIAGNIFGDKDSVESLTKWGADAIKVGLAYGRACITKNKTGIASPMFSSGLEASKWTNLPLIGDGSIKENGDIALGLYAGYDMVMAGSMFAACRNSPAGYEPIGSGYVDYKKKVYFGSASCENGNDKNIEGRCVYLDCNNMTIVEKLEEIKQDLSSTVSFLGGKDLSCIKMAECQFVLA